jgi:hypothetical protein
MTKLRAARLALRPCPSTAQRAARSARRSRRTTRASQAQAASSEVSARYDLVFQQALMSYYTGELDPARVALGS